MKNLTNLINKPLKSLNLPSIIDVVLDIKHNNKSKMVLHCMPEYEDKIKINFINGELNLSVVPGNYYEKIVIELNASSLEKINLSGTGNVSGSYTGEELSVKIPGTGDVELTGEVINLDIKLSGTGNAELKNLVSQNSLVVISGTGDAKVNAEKDCEVKLSGTGSATIYGNPQNIKKKNSGVGNIKFVGQKNEKSSDASSIKNKSSFFKTNTFNDIFDENNDIFSGTNDIFTNDFFDAQSFKNKNKNMWTMTRTIIKPKDEDYKEEKEEEEFDEKNKELSKAEILKKKIKKML